MFHGQIPMNSTVRQTCCPPSWPSSLGTRKVRNGSPKTKNPRVHGKDPSDKFNHGELKKP